jgi:hypothetical protein
MMSNEAWVALIFLSLAVFLIVAGFTVKAFRYKYGGFKVPRIVGGIVCVGLGAMCLWIAVLFALRA